MNKNLIVKSTEGLHASKCAEIVRTATQFTSDISLTYNNKEIDLKSILGLLSLCIRQNEKISLVVEGKDSEAAINALEKLI